MMPGLIYCLLMGVASVRSNARLIACAANRCHRVRVQRSGAAGDRIDLFAGFRQTTQLTAGIRLSGTASPIAPAGSFLGFRVRRWRGHDSY